MAKVTLVRLAATDSPECLKAKADLKAAQSVVNTLAPIVAKANLDAAKATATAKSLQAKLLAAQKAMKAAEDHVKLKCPAGSRACKV